ncbi:GDP-L-fucose synthase [uncultured archaeon]|nr:GDP-L-fucose synthase [uncultured archaeon]
MDERMKILITGGSGFIGSNFVHYLLDKYPDERLVVLDKLTYAGKLENLKDVMDKIIFIKGDICNAQDIAKAGKCDIIFNFAAETHVDRSIKSADVFVKTDVLGTYNLLEFARKNDIRRYIQISTDEVYGSTVKDSFHEDDLLDPSSPYSASKAGADLLVGAFFKTYNLPVLITRSSNNFGPYQYPEKLIPVLILKALHDKALPIYGNGLNVRDWIYVKDNCAGIDYVFRKGKTGEIYNIGAGNEKTNIEIANQILMELKISKNLIKYVKDRPGHDFRYSLNCEKIKNLGWSPQYKFEDALRYTVKWYTENDWWWKSIIFDNNDIFN